VLTSIDDHVAILRTINPPTTARACHAQLLSSLDHYNLMTAYLSYGILAGDAQAIQQSSREASIATDNLTAYTNCISSLR
jgi:hypothetical protein